MVVLKRDLAKTKSCRWKGIQGGRGEIKWEEFMTIVNVSFSSAYVACCVLRVVCLSEIVMAKDCVGIALQKSIKDCIQGFSGETLAATSLDFILLD